MAGADRVEDKALVAAEAIAVITVAVKLSALDCVRGGEEELEVVDEFEAGLEQALPLPPGLGRMRVSSLLQNTSFNPPEGITHQCFEEPMSITSNSHANENQWFYPEKLIFCKDKLISIKIS